MSRCRGPSRPRHPLSAASISESCASPSASLPAIRPTTTQWRAAETFVASTLARAVPAGVRATVGEGIGLAGTFTTLVACKLELRTYDRALVHRHKLTLADLDGALATFRGETAAARGRRPGIQPGREDVILAGVLLARRGLRALRARRRAGERSRPARRRRPLAGPRLKAQLAAACAARRRLPAVAIPPRRRADVYCPRRCRSGGTVDAGDLKSPGLSARVGSTPTSGTTPSGSAAADRLRAL